MHGVNSLLQFNGTAHVVDDHRRSTAFIDQWDLSIDSLLSGCDVPASAVTKSLALDCLQAAQNTAVVLLSGVDNRHTRYVGCVHTPCQENR